jgi:hypothetical protein
MRSLLEVEVDQEIEFDPRRPEDISSEDLREPDE